MKKYIKNLVVFVTAFYIGITINYRASYLESQPKLTQQNVVKNTPETGFALKTAVNNKVETDLIDSGLPKIVRRSNCFPIKPLFRPVPQYPKEAKEKRLFGDVVIEVDIDKSGDVVKARVLSGHPLLQETAIVAACKTTFVVSRLNNCPVPVTAILTYRFKLD